jgi:hypothetical protein
MEKYQTNILPKRELWSSACGKTSWGGLLTEYKTSVKQNRGGWMGGRCGMGVADNIYIYNYI